MSKIELNLVTLKSNPALYADGRKRFEKLMEELHGCRYVSGRCTIHTEQAIRVPQEGFNWDRQKRIVSTRSKNTSKPRGPRRTRSEPEPGIFEKGNS